MDNQPRKGGETKAKADGDPDKQDGHIGNFLGEHWLGLTLFTIALFLMSPILSFPGGNPRQLWWVCAGVCLLVNTVIIWAFYVLISRLGVAADTKSVATQVAVISEDLKATFKGLRQSFESLALKSSGLHHVLVERKQRTQDQEPDNDFIPPVVTTNRPSADPRTVIGYESPPGEASKPRRLTDEERDSAPAASVGDAYIRDGQGRALAVWESAVVRSGYIYGDNSVYQQFHNLAEAAGNALFGIPDELVARLPDNIRELCRPGQHRNQRYVFGIVPGQPNRWIANGWSAGVLTFDNGVIIDNPESPTGGHSPSAIWLHLLHRLGWSASLGSMLNASQWYWLDQQSISFSFATHFPNDHFAPQMPRHRFYSVLGTENGSPTDVCWASVWAIDQLLKLLS